MSIRKKRERERERDNIMGQNVTQVVYQNNYQNTFKICQATLLKFLITSQCICNNVVAILLNVGLFQTLRLVNFKNQQSKVTAQTGWLTFFSNQKKQIRFKPVLMTAQELVMKRGL